MAFTIVPFKPLHEKRSKRYRLSENMMSSANFLHCFWSINSQVTIITSTVPLKYIIQVTSTVPLKYIIQVTSTVPLKLIIQVTTAVSLKYIIQVTSTVPLNNMIQMVKV